MGAQLRLRRHAYPAYAATRNRRVVERHDWVTLLVIPVTTYCDVFVLAMQALMYLCMYLCIYYVQLSSIACRDARSCHMTQKRSLARTVVWFSEHRPRRRPRSRISDLPSHTHIPRIHCAQHAKRSSFVAKLLVEPRTTLRRRRRPRP